MYEALCLNALTKNCHSHSLKIRSLKPPFMKRSVKPSTGCFLPPVGWDQFQNTLGGTSQENTLYMFEFNFCSFEFHLCLSVTHKLSAISYEKENIKTALLRPQPPEWNDSPSWIK